MIILVCAFVLASGAAFIVYRLVGAQMDNNAHHRTSKVATAARDLPIGTLIKPTDINTTEIVGDLPKDVILTPEAAVGRGVTSTLYEGEPLMGKRLAAVGSGAGLAATIPPGMRACAVKVDQVVGVAGFVVPGMRVDVIISGNNTASEANVTGMRVKTLLENIEVLSAGTNIQKDEEGKPISVQVVNLLVDPEQAELLSLASNDTKIQLVLRNPLDTQIAKPPGAEMAGLFGGPVPNPAAAAATRVVSVQSTPRPAPVMAPPPPAIWVVKVLNGAKATSETFPAAGK
jgi:pilus assembly protein CpaB